VLGNWPFVLSFAVRNAGSAPLYYAWPIKVSMLHPHTREAVYHQKLKGTDVRQWMPGDRWVWWQGEDEVAPQTYEVKGEVALSATLQAGPYIVAQAVLDHAGDLPAARFAITS
jgi:hypothetical protein